MKMSSSESKRRRRHEGILRYVTDKPGVSRREIWHNAPWCGRVSARGLSSDLRMLREEGRLEMEGFRKAARYFVTGKAPRVYGKEKKPKDVRIHRCGTCGEIGHNIRTCVAALVEAEPLHEVGEVRSPLESGSIANATEAVSEQVGEWIEGQKRLLFTLDVMVEEHLQEINFYRDLILAFIEGRASLPDLASAIAK